MRQPGMTLMELLVVIAIIIVLASILFPVMFAAHRHASEARCISHLKQIGMAVTAFRQETGMYPAPGKPVSTLISAKLLSEMPSCPFDKGTPKPHDTYSPMYNYWGYDLYPPETRGEPKPLTTRALANGVYNTTNPDGRYTSAVPGEITSELRYYWDSANAMPDSDFPGLVNTNAPASTIVIVCKMHHPINQRFFILRVDGSVDNSKDPSDQLFFTLSKAAVK